MGGGSGGSLSGLDIQALEAKAKEKLAEASESSSRHVFISFSHEDLQEVNLLRGQSKNKDIELTFDDHSVKAPYNSENADYIKRNIREKIDRCSVTLVYLSASSGTSDWVNWEIQESIKRGKGVIGVYTGDAPPSNLPSEFTKHGCKAVKWGHRELSAAIEEASSSR